ncbi:branched-chain amino acid ABC transporter permease, partial [Rhizobium ruizarguesonis]
MADITDAISTENNRTALSVQASFLLAGLLLLLLAPFFFYPIFLMKLLSFSLFACAFTPLLGHTDLLSFGPVTFFGGVAYF